MGTNGRIAQGRGKEEERKKEEDYGVWEKQIIAVA
jgi:hypothetical protein